MDALTLLQSNSLATSDPHVRLSLIGLREATGWQAANDHLRELHGLVHRRRTIIPLWQLRDHFAVRQGVKGFDDAGVTLYQGIDRWQIEPPSTATLPTSLTPFHPN